MKGSEEPTQDHSKLDTILKFRLAIFILSQQEIVLKHGKVYICGKVLIDQEHVFTVKTTIDLSPRAAMILFIITTCILF